MPDTEPTIRIRRPHPRSLSILTLHGLGAVLATGCSIWHFEGNVELCYDAHEECLEDAHSADDRRACDDDRDDCVASCDGSGGGSWDDDGDGDGDTGDGDGDAGDGDGDAGDGDGETGDGETGDGGEIPDVCLELHQNCIAQAETLLDVEACEALFDQCVEPPPCEDDECAPCPDPALEGCLDAYAGCIAAANTQADIDACEAGFDACAEGTNEECLPDYGPEVLEECLAQHALCVACADDDAHVAQCHEIFDACIQAG
jgi:hypothetical protein